MTRIKKIAPAEPLRPCSLKLPPTAEDLLRDLRQEASDRLGWTVSSSAVVRALLRYVAEQPPAWRQTALFPLIDQEIAQGRVWGKRRRAS